jgi:hypothetical protein
MFAGSAVFSGESEFAEPFSEGIMKNPLTDPGVRWSGKRDLKGLHGE